MLRTYKYKSLKYFSITFLISWITWFFAAYVSRQSTMQNLILPSILVGLGGPSIALLIIFIQSRNKDLWYDFFQKFRLSIIKKKFIPISILLFPCLFLITITISLFFGGSTNQFFILSESTDIVLKGQNLLRIILIIFLVGPFEEIGWRGYGIDSLLSKFNLMKTSLIFGVVWGAWHIPGFFIKHGVFQQEYLNLGPLQTAFYFVDVLLLGFIVNWLYIKNNRSILICIIFHSIYDIILGVFQVEPITKIIFTIVLLITVLIIVQRNKELFFKKINF